MFKLIGVIINGTIDVLTNIFSATTTGSQMLKDHTDLIKAKSDHHIRVDRMKLDADMAAFEAQLKAEPTIKSADLKAA